jgi:hypothetical protein
MNNYQRLDGLNDQSTVSHHMEDAQQAEALAVRKIWFGNGPGDRSKQGCGGV